MKPPATLKYGKEEQARHMNIRKPPLRKEDRHNAKAREAQTNRWIFLRSMKWQPGNENGNGISWIELLALAGRKGIKWKRP